MKNGQFGGLDLRNGEKMAFFYTRTRPGINVGFRVRVWASGTRGIGFRVTRAGYPSYRYFERL